VEAESAAHAEKAMTAMDGTCGVQSIDDEALKQLCIEQAATGSERIVDSVS
jgi:hypothetical protein